MPRISNRPLTLLATAMVLILATTTSASANNAPTALALGLLGLQALLLFSLTALGGGYLVMRRLKELKYPVKWKRTISSALELFAGGVLLFIGLLMPVFVMLVLGIFALGRGGSLFLWGREAAKAPERPAHLVDLHPQRLKLAGALLILSMLLICAYSMLNIAELIGYGNYRAPGRVSLLNTDARQAYDVAMRYLEQHPQAKVVTCADLQASGYTPSREDLVCFSDLNATSGNIRITGPEKWQLSVPTATIDATGTLTSAQR